MTGKSSFDWRDFLKLAEELIDDCDKSRLDEAIKRTAISRAYYGVFNLTKQLAINYLYFHAEKSAEDHKRLRDFFYNYANAIKENISDSDYKQLVVFLNYLEDLRRWRNECDYDETVKNLDAKLQNALKKSHFILNVLDKFKEFSKHS
ncbi:hypothetical protein QQE94_00610 [Fervidobacterium pennivorans subsp. shakshaketiis]|uniref:hypothetical protein n=1 Tax=Fervidobacterium pennivorans TaxID=93466 RepID=UPI00355B61EC